MTRAANGHPRLLIDQWIAFEKTLAPKVCGLQDKSEWPLQSSRTPDHIGETQVQVRRLSPVRFACLVFVSFKDLSASPLYYVSRLSQEGL